MIRIATNHIGTSLLLNRCFLRAAATGAGRTQDALNKSSPDQLNQVAEKLSQKLVKFFVETHPRDLYTKDVVLIDNIRSIRVQGLTQYLIQIALIKIYYHLNYTSKKLELLSLVKLPEESCIRIRWRVITKPGLTSYILFLFKIHKMEEWKDGISTMHVNKDGLIYCHVCDNIDVDIDAKEKKTLKNPLVDRGLSV